MAIGLLGTGTTTGGTPVSVYTVPASGVSHSVVHITLCSNNDGRTVSVDGVEILRTKSGSAKDEVASSVSMMLSPGNEVTVEGGNEAYCTVSGYEVPS